MDGDRQIIAFALLGLLMATLVFGLVVARRRSREHRRRMRHWRPDWSKKRD